MVNVWRILLERMLLSVSLGSPQLMEKSLVSVPRMALYGHVYVKFHEVTCINAGLSGCGVGSDLCMRPCSTSCRYSVAARRRTVCSM